MMSSEIGATLQGKNLPFPLRVAPILEEIRKKTFQGFLGSSSSCTIDFCTIFTLFFSLDRCS